MKQLAILSLLAFLFFPLKAQDDRVEILQDLESARQSGQTGISTATLNSASRLFADKDDLTSVLLVIPKGATVTILGFDDTYLRVSYEGNEGYIYTKHATIDPEPIKRQADVRQREPVNQRPAARPVQRESRFTYLEKKYGGAIASRLYAGKVWKGMTSEMVKDSWGSPHKINRVISGNNVREEWIYKSSWLFLENSILVDWGATRR